MYDPYELITIIWNPSIRKHYTERGYNYTESGSEFQVYLKDIQKTCTTGIMTGFCDYCNRSMKISVIEYFRRTKKETKKFACDNKECQRLRNKEYRYNNSQKESYDQYLSNCADKGFIPMTTFDEIENARSKVIFICPIHGKITTDLWSAAHSGCTCKKCTSIKSSRNLTLTKEELIKRVNAKNNDVLLNPDDYMNCNEKNLRVQCGSCGSVFVTSLNSVKNGGGRCRDCANKSTNINSRITPDEIERRVNSVNGNILLNKSEAKTPTSRLEIMCSCGNIFHTNLRNYEHHPTNRCRRCSRRESSGEFLVRNILLAYNISFDIEHKFSDCKDKGLLRFDFYLPDYNVCIEYDGQLHYEARVGRGGDKQLADRQRKDKIKDDYCKNNNIGLLRIPYYKSQNAEDMICDFLHLPKIHNQETKLNYKHILD